MSVQYRGVESVSEARRINAQGLLKSDHHFGGTVSTGYPELIDTQSVDENPRHEDLAQP